MRNYNKRSGVLYGIDFYASDGTGKGMLDMTKRICGLVLALCMVCSLMAAACADGETYMKYAVSVYGIGVDEGRNGEKLGLTFGPALGVATEWDTDDVFDVSNYIVRTAEHNPSGSTADGNARRCIHRDSWEEIIEWNRNDPYVYEQCIAAGCSKSIPLHISEKLAGEDYSEQYADESAVSGDGTSVLYRELKEEARGWNAYYMEATDKNRWSKSNYATWYNNAGGWAASNIRAVLNGVQEETSSGSFRSKNGMDDSVADGIVWAVSEGIDESNALISGFPEELRAAIGERKTIARSFCGREVGEDDCVYDKLWLLSEAEVGADYQNDEGVAYPKLSGIGSSGYEKARIGCSLVCAPGIMMPMRTAWWLRSMAAPEDADIKSSAGDSELALSRAYETVRYVAVEGLVNGYASHYYHGVAPCFCLAR